MATISVIVPVYNAEKYLDKCIQSILNQSYDDFELILINDGSTDMSGAICEEYVRKDLRVKLFNQINCGVSSARNSGLDIASGEWITFIDSDDWVEKNYLENLIMGNQRFDIVVNYYYAIGWSEWKSEPFDDCQYEKTAISACLNKNLRRFSFICCKLYRNKIIKDNSLRFNTNISYAEDSIFTFTYMQYVNSIRTLPDALYCYNCFSNESLTSKKISWTSTSYTINEMCDAICKLEKEFAWDGKQVKCYYTWAFLRKYINSIVRDDSIWESRNNLKLVNENRYVLDMYNSNVIAKSKFRKLFDALMYRRMFFLVAIMIHCEKFLIKYGVLQKS